MFADSIIMKAILGIKNSNLVHEKNSIFRVISVIRGPEKLCT